MTTAECTERIVWRRQPAGGGTMLGIGFTTGRTEDREDSRLSMLDLNAGHYSLLSGFTERGREPGFCLDPPGIRRAAIHERAVALALAPFAS